MSIKQFIVIILIIFFTNNSAGFDFEVECDQAAASKPQVAAYFQKYVGKWSGEWKVHELFNLYPGRVRKTAARFQYGDVFRVEVVSVNGCDILFKVYYDHEKDGHSTYKAKVMTEEGFYIYWTSPTVDGTYILIYDERKDILEGIFQLFEGQNIASIIMKRS